MAKKLIESDHFKNFINLGGLKKRNSKILYTKTESSVDKNDYFTDLCILDTQTKKFKTLTNGIEVDLYKWYEDDKVIFTAITEESDKNLRQKQIPITVFYSMDVETGIIEKLFNVSKKIIEFERISADKFFFLCSDTLCDDQYLKLAEGNWEKFSQIKKEEEDYFVAEEVPFWTNSAGYCNGKRGRIFLYEKESLIQITPDDLHVTLMKAYEDEYLLYCGLQSGGIQSTAGKLYRYDIQEKNTVPLDITEEYIYTLIETVSSTEFITCRSDRKIHGEYQDEYIDLINMKDGSCLRKNSFGDYHIYDNVVCDVSYLSNWLNKVTRCRNGIYFIATEMESSKVFFWEDEAALPVAITKAKGKVIDYEIVGNDIYIIAMRGLGGTELYRHSLKDKKEEKITSYNANLEEIYQYAPVERLNYTNKNQIEIQGWYLKPVHFEEGKKYPAILFIHGGPQCAFGEIFNHDMQLMAAKGYGVLFCNPTGSEGRCGDFADIRKKYGTIDYEDLIGFTQHATEHLPWIDKNRLGVTGGSYGGIMTNWIIGHTNMFCAAVSDRGVCNNISDFGLSDIGVSFGPDTFEATPWKNFDYLWETSALKYAPYIKTPVLLIHGMEDYRCPYDSALQMHTALTYFGVPSKVFAFKGENHELCRSGQPKHRVRRLEEMANWFDIYILNEERIKK